MSEKKGGVASVSQTPLEPPPSYETSTSAPSSSTSRPPASRSPRPAPPPLDHPALNAIRSRRTILASASPRRRQLLSQIGIGPQHIETIASAHPEDFPKYGVSPFEYVLQTATAKALAVYRAELNNTAKGEPELVIAADTVVVGTGGEILEKPRSEREHVEMLRALRDGGSVHAATAAAATVLSRSGGGGVMSEAINAGLGAGMRGESGPAMARVPGKKDTATANGAAAANGDSAAAAASAGWHKVYTGVAVMAPLASARDPGYALETAVEETDVRFDPTVSDETILAYVRTREGADKAGGYGIQAMGGLLIEKIDGSWDNVVGLPLRLTLRLVEKVVKSADADDGDEDDLLLSGDEDSDAA